MIEHGVICNGDPIIMLETKKIADKKCTWWYTLRSSGLTKKNNIKSVVVGIITRCRRIYLKNAILWRIKKFYTDFITFMAQTSGSMESWVYGPCLHYWSGILINTRFFQVVWSNLSARQENSDDNIDSKGNIFQKRHTKIPGIRQCPRILRWRS